MANANTATTLIDLLKSVVSADGTALNVAGGAAGGGDASAANQVTGNASLASIDTKTPALGAAAKAASVPVNIASDQTVPVSIASMPSTPVTGTFFQSTQPVSIASMPSTPVTGTFFQSTQPVSIASMPSTPVTGPLTDTQLRATAVPVSIATMPSTPVTGPLTDTQIRATPLPVSGTVAVTGALTDTQLRATAVPVSIASMPTTPVTGTFFQATQPVSIAASVPVTGTFFQATQPVSIAATVAVSGPLTDTQIRATALPVSGTVAVTGVATEATLSALNNKVTAVNTGAVVLAAGSASIGTVLQAALTKGTQGTLGVTTQDLKDAGRNQTNYFMAVPAISTATDALVSLTGYKAGAAVVATTSPAVVTTGKTYRINKIVLNYVAIATAGTIKFTLRANTAGVVAIGSPAVANWIIGAGAAVAGVSQTVDLAIPEGIEFAAATGIGISMVGLSATQVAAAVGYGQISIHGYEY